MLIIFVAGMILESAAVIVLLIPIILPMLQAAQVDLMWFGVMASFMIAVGLLTPPVGLSTYAAAAAARVPVTAIFRSAAPFAAFSALIVTGLMLVFPGLVTWLPSRIR
jgi:C4-dicarboxylate transporter, DctM subunit